jgi:hypothetical protein
MGLGTTDTFTDARGQHYVASVPVSEAIWARYEYAAAENERLRGERDDLFLRFTKADEDRLAFRAALQDYAGGLVDRGRRARNALTKED